MSQNIQILNYLRSGKTITPIEALNLFGCFRLSGRIKDLKDEGFNIQTDIVENNGKRFANYRLIRSEFQPCFKGFHPVIEPQSNARLDSKPEGTHGSDKPGYNHSAPTMKVNC